MCKWTNDSQRFLLEHFDTIHNSPSHIYHSALPFSPSSSWLHKCYSKELSQEVKVVKGLPAEWGTCSRTVSLDISVQDLSYWNNTIAVGSSGGNIIILNAITGSQEAILSGHTGWVRSITYSPDGVSLVSGSSDKTIKLWDVQTGGVVKTFYGHTQGVCSVSISADKTRIASGSFDCTIRLWDIHTGKCHCVIKQEDKVEHVSFFPIDSQHLLSICNDKVWQWDINGYQSRSIYNGSYVAFSSDGAQFISSHKTIATVRNSSSGLVVTEFQIANGHIYQCCFSPDDRLVAVNTGITAHIWDITSSKPHLIENFIGHTQRITSLVFYSPSSLISASIDHSVKFWQIGSSSADPLEANPQFTSPILAPIISTNLQVRDGIAITSDSDGVVKTWDILTGLCKASFQTPAKHSHIECGMLANGRLILVWYTDQKINIWDVKKAELLFVVNKPNKLKDLKISGDGSRVFCLGEGFLQALSVQTGKIVGKVNVKVSSHHGFLSVDGSRVWVHYHGLEDQGWDFGTPGSSPVQLPNIPAGRHHPNGIMLWDTGLSGIREKATGKVVFQLPKRYGEPVDLQWNGQHLVVCFTPREVLILDFSHIL